MNSMLQTPEQHRRPGMAGSQGKGESSWQRHSASTDGLCKDTPSTETHSLHPRSVTEQWDTSHHKEERGPVLSSRPSLSGLKEGPSPIGAYGKHSDG